MLEQIWSARVGKGAIDCSYDAHTDTISVGDTTGRFVILDANGTLIDQGSVSMPIWGISHVFDEHGSPILAICEGTHQPQTNEVRGAFTVINRAERNSMHRIETRDPCWDAFILDGVAWGTCWSGKLLSTPIAGDSDRRVTQTELGNGAAHGICADNFGQLHVVLAGSGVVMVNPATLQVTQTLGSTDVAYNIQTSGDFTIGGSTTRGMAVVGDRLLPAEIETSLKGHIAAVSTCGDEFVILGDLDGGLTVASLVQRLTELEDFLLPQGIWHLEYDEASSRLYVACGDGRLYAYDVDLGPALSITSVSNIRGTVKTRPVDVASLKTAVGSLATRALALREIEHHWDAFSPDDVTQLQSFLEECSEATRSDRARFLLGLSQLESGEPDQAIVTLQAISQNSQYFRTAILPLARAFESIDSLGTASTVLRANLERLGEKELPAALFYLGELNERRHQYEEALTAFEAVSFHDHGYPGVRDALRRLRRVMTTDDHGSPAVAESGRSLVEFENSTPATLSSRRRLGYDTISYVLYENGPPADEIKKALEEEAMDSLLQANYAASGRSLDIGCATGRWPLWFARRGWDASGYDIAPDAISICEYRSLQAGFDESNPRFATFDISSGALEPGAFDIATCMMGTFSHIPLAALPSFVAGISESLAPGGRLVFTAWNAESRFCDFLNLDGEEAKAALRANAQGSREIIQLLEGSGFGEIHSAPLCFLPNDCYDTWDHGLEDPRTTLLEIDRLLRSRIDPRHAQMSLYTAKKREEQR